jgi:aconitase A
VHAENLVRRCRPGHAGRLLLQLIERRRDLDFPWFPARVVCHDILGQTALVDLAGLRDAIAEQGGDPAQVNPVVPVQLIVDHSLAVECGGFDPDAFAKNRAIEDRRNEDRFHFIELDEKSLQANVDVIPAGNGIMHQINLEKMSPVMHACRTAWPTPTPASAPTATRRTSMRWASSPSAWAAWKPRT